MDIAQMSAKRPYLFRAFYDWIVDNELTPHILVNATEFGVDVPLEFVQDGKIVLNLAPYSIGNYVATNDYIEFDARFGGKPHHIIIPMLALQAVYARENGVGLSFEEEPQYVAMREQQQTDQSTQNPESNSSNPKNNSSTNLKSNNPFKIVK